LNRKIKTFLKVVLPLALGIVLVWYSLSKISFQTLLQYFKNADYFYIGLGLIFGLLSHLSRAYRWKFMIEPMGYTLKMPNSIMAVFAAYLVNYTIPRAGEIARGTILTNYEGVPFEKGFGTIVAERIADMLMMVLIIVITLFLEFEFIYEFFSSRFHPLKMILLSAILLGLAVLFFVLVKNSTSKIAIRVKSFIKGLVEGLLTIFKMRKKWAFIFHTVFIWAMYILMFYITTYSIEEAKNLPMAAILLGFISASFSIAATNGGIGSYPVAVYAAFSMFSIAKEPSIAFGWIMWSSQTLMIIILGGLSLIYLPIYNRRK